MQKLLIFQGFEDQIAQYKIVRRIYGSEDSPNGVWLAKCRITRKQVVLKATPLKEYYKLQSSELSEHQTMEMCRNSSHVLQLIEAFEYKASFYIATPYAEHGDLTDYL